MEWHQPIHSTDLFPRIYTPSPSPSPDVIPSTPSPSNILRVRGDLFPITQSSEYHQLIHGEILNSPQYSTSPEPNGDDWGDDEDENAELNIHMDVYEGWGCDYDEVNVLFLKKYK